MLARAEAQEPAGQAVWPWRGDETSLNVVSDSAQAPYHQETGPEPTFLAQKEGQVETVSPWEGAGDSVTRERHLSRESALSAPGGPGGLRG